MLELKLNIIKKLKEIWEQKESLPQARFQTLRLPLDSINLSELILYTSQSPLAYWKNKEDTKELLGLGSNLTYKKIELYSELLEQNKSNPDLYFMGGQRFSQDKNWGKEWTSFGEMYFFLPIILIERDKEAYSIVISYPTEIHSNTDAQGEFIFQLEQLLTWERQGLSYPSAEKSYQMPEKPTWESNIETCLENLAEEEHKVVLARKVIQESDISLCPLTLLQEIKENAVDSYLFLLKISPTKAFISLTPERLFKLEHNQVTTDALAGTRPRGEDIPKDNEYSLELLGNRKELNEHRIVKNEIEEKLEELCYDITPLKSEEILKLKYVQHIYSSYSATLKEHIDITHLIDQLHPTPAVGGRPWSKAKQTIKDLECFDRGFYAAPIGVINSQHTDFAVGIRSALIDNNQLHLFSGAGIVRGSRGPEEWIETQNKLKGFPIQL